MKTIGILALLGLVCTAMPSTAQLTTYTDRASFLAAAGGGLSSATFNTLGGNSYQTLSSSNEASIPAGVVFSSNSGGPSDLFVAPTNFNGNTAIASPSLFANFFGTPLIADFSPLVTAVGADVIPFDFANDTGTISIAVHDNNGNTTSYNVTPPVGSASFFGVISSGALSIDRISYTPPANYTAGVDNFVFGQAAAVPEPGACALVGGLSVPGLLLLRRRRA
jgi:hypothetical protein